MPYQSKSIPQPPGCNCPSSDAALAFLNALTEAALEDNGRYGRAAARSLAWWAQHWLELRQRERAA